MQSKYAIFVLSYDSDSDQPVNDLQGDEHDVGSSISGKLEASEAGLFEPRVRRKRRQSWTEYRTKALLH